MGARWLRPQRLRPSPSVATPSTPFSACHPSILTPIASIPRPASAACVENLKLLIVDEVSVVLLNLIDVIDHTLKSVRRNNWPFGGAPVLFVGDLFQLPPVVATPEERVYFSHRYRSRFFFSAEVFRDMRVQPVQLKRVFRQADTEFVAALNHIRVGEGGRITRCYSHTSLCRSGPGEGGERAGSGDCRPSGVRGKL